MIKYLFTTALMFINIIVFSQFYLGVSKDSVMKDIPAKYKIEEQTDQDGITTLSWTDEGINTMESVSFIKNVSRVFIIVPLSQVATNSWVSSFNNHYVKTSDTTWDAYSNGRIYDITMKYFEKANGYAITIKRKGDLK